MSPQKTLNRIRGNRSTRRPFIKIKNGSSHPQPLEDLFRSVRVSEVSLKHGQRAVLPEDKCSGVLEAYQAAHSPEDFKGQKVFIFGPRGCCGDRVREKRVHKCNILKLT